MLPNEEYSTKGVERPGRMKGRGPERGRAPLAVDPGHMVRGVINAKRVCEGVCALRLPAPVGNGCLHENAACREQLVEQH